VLSWSYTSPYPTLFRSFIKTVLSVQHGHIPRHLNFEQLTPHAGAGASQFTIAAEPLGWPDVGRVRRAGVSSFGVSGTNAHVIVEDRKSTRLNYSHVKLS